MLSFFKNHYQEKYGIDYVKLHSDLKEWVKTLDKKKYPFGFHSETFNKKFNMKLNEKEFKHIMNILKLKVINFIGYSVPLEQFEQL